MRPAGICVLPSVSPGGNSGQDKSCDVVKRKNGAQGGGKVLPAALGGIAGLGLGRKVNVHAKQIYETYSQLGQNKKGREGTKNKA